MTRSTEPAMQAGLTVMGSPMAKPPVPPEHTPQGSKPAAPHDESFEGDTGDDSGRIYDRGDTMKAWEDFLASRQEPRTSQTLVRNVIEQSWQRSRKSGVDARGHGSTRILSEAELERLRLENDDLLGSARQTFQSIAKILGDAATMAIITDCSGIILEVGGDRQTIDNGHDIRLEVGAAWGEGITGTNGIGTALATGQAIHVHAAEHFCEGVKAWTCVGAPIHSPVDGRIIGVIDFSGPQEIFHRHNVALALVSATHIELALTEKIRLERMQLLEASLRRMPRLGTTDGIVIFDRFGRVVHHNETASQRLRAFLSSDVLRPGAKMLDVDGVLRESALEDRLPEELRGQSIVPLSVNGEVKGAMLVVRPKSSLTPAGGGSTPVNTAVSMVKSQIVGESPALLQSIERVERAAVGRTAILLEGETGVGKELFAQLAHAVSARSGKEPFVALNCGAVSKELLGSELFGHAAGAFTGATREGRAGRFEAASGGTLSLDEIGEMPLDLQPYLLRVLEENVVYRLGESKPRPVNVRLIASTNRNLKQEVAEGRFRKDLYFRISAVKITIPPLRERPGDIELLIDHFNQVFAKTYGRTPLIFDQPVHDLFLGYDWPGNIRELRNLIENLTLTASPGTIGLSDLPEDFAEPILPPPTPRTAASDAATDMPATPQPIVTLDESERYMIQQALADAGGNVSLAAQKLGISRSTLYRKLQHYRSS